MSVGPVYKGGVSLESTPGHSIAYRAGESVSPNASDIGGIFTLELLSRWPIG